MGHTYLDVVPLCPHPLEALGPFVALTTVLEHPDLLPLVVLEQDPGGAACVATRRHAQGAHDSVGIGGDIESTPDGGWGRPELVDSDGGDVRALEDGEGSEGANDAEAKNGDIRR